MRGTCSPGFVVRADVRARADPAAARSRTISRADDGPGLAHPLVARLARHRHRRVRPRPRLRARAGAARRRASRRRPRCGCRTLLQRARRCCAPRCASGARGLLERDATTSREPLSTMSARCASTRLKIAASEQAPRICQGAMGVCGIVGYKNDTPFSVGRHLRDAMSACLMIANERIHATNAVAAARRKGGLSRGGLPPGDRRTRRRTSTSSSTQGCSIPRACPASTAAARSSRTCAAPRRLRRARAAPERDRALRFPPVLPRDSSRRSATSSRSRTSPGRLRVRRRRARRARAAGAGRQRTRTGASSSSMTDLVLMPAACYPVYPAIARRGAAAEGGVAVDPAAPTCSATSRRGDPARLQMFHQREIVRIGEPDDVAGLARRLARPRRSSCCARSGSTRTSTSPPTRSSAGAGRMLAASQREQALKFEILVQIAGAGADRGRVVQLPPGPLRVDVRASQTDGELAHTACLGLRARADHARPASDARPRPGRVAGGGQRALWAVSVGPAELLRARSRDLRAARGARRRAGLHARRTATRTSSIELLHARGDEPLAALGFTLRMDFEGDQWTFFKPPPEDLEQLFGIDVHEMQPYRPLPSRSRSSSARTDDDRRARLVVPARHARDAYRQRRT